MLARIARPGLVNDAPRPPAFRARCLPPKGAECARAPGWSDDDRLWDALAPALAAPARRAVADTEVAAILEATRPPSGGRVLDLGCGAGAHAVAFAARGYRVTGVDRNETLLGAARRAASEAGVDVELLHADFRTFSRPAAFDLACSLNASFAYFDDATHRRLLKILRRSLRGGGSLVLDTLGEGRAAWAGDAGTHEIGGARYSVRRAFDESRGVLREEWTVERGGRPETIPLRAAPHHRRRAGRPRRGGRLRGREGLLHPRRRRPLRRPLPPPRPPRAATRVEWEGACARCLIQSA